MHKVLMGLSLILPVAALSKAQATSPSIPEAVTLPGDSVIVRDACFFSQREMRRKSSSAGLGAGGTQSGVSGLGSRGRGSGGSGYGKSSSAPFRSSGGPYTAGGSAAKPSSARSQKSAVANEAYAVADEASVAPTPAPQATAPTPQALLDLSPPARVDSFSNKDKQPAFSIDQVSGTLGRANLDWGGLTYLSNDDSMSLASAQRVLYAVENGVALKASEIRPHELLNYFSFDTVEPVGRSLFGVHGSAERTSADTLSLALSVRGALPERKPLDMTVVVDRSGSMRAEGRMEYTKRGLRKMSEQLHRGDRIDIVLFDHEVCTPLENFVVGRDNPELLQRTIDQMQPKGSTDLNKGLNEGYRLARGHVDSQGRNRRLMVLTDALLNTGDVNTDTVSEIAKAYERDGIRLTGVGVGRGFNDTMLDKLTEKGKGAYVFLGSEAVVDRIFGVGFESLVTTLAHDVHFSLDLPPSLAIERFYGEESSTNKADIQPINYYAGTSQVFLQDLKIRGSGLNRQSPFVTAGQPHRVILTVEYEDASTGRHHKNSFVLPVKDLLAADTHNVTKARALMSFSDMLLDKALGGSGCDEALDGYASLSARLTDDLELGYINGLVSRVCPMDLTHHYVPAPAYEASVEYKVKVDSDVPIAEVALACGSQQQVKSLSGGNQVARFSARPGACSVRFNGPVAMTTHVSVPTTGGDVRCVIRGGRLSCTR